MALRAVLAPFFAFFAFLCLGVQGEYCYSYYYRGYTLYCDYGCCGDYYDKYCCTYTLGVPAIIGIVLGCLSLIAVIVVIVCCCIKSHGKTGRVVQPNANRPPNGYQPNVTVIYRGGQPGPAYGMQPTGGQHAGPNYATKPAEYPPPPPYYRDPAYPPGAVPGASNPAGTNDNPFGPPIAGFAQPPASTSAAPQ